jgi:hypothetical protein
VLVAAFSSSFETHLALFDPSTRRVLPGSTALGFGPVRRLVDDGEGNVVSVSVNRVEVRGGGRFRGRGRETWSWRFVEVDDQK